MPRGLGAAMLESRQRWRDFALLDHDLLFETDSKGRFAFLAPPIVLGHAAAALLGAPAARLLSVGNPSPFALRRPTRNHLARLRAADGTPRSFRFSVAPLVDEHGQFAGLRGVARDVTEIEASTAETAALARRHQVLLGVTQGGRRDMGRHDAPDRALRRITRALGCAGGAVLGPWSKRQPQPALLAGELPALDLIAGLQRSPRDPLVTRANARPLVIIPKRKRTLGAMALVLWRNAGMRDFDEDDIAVLAVFSEIIAGLMMQSQLALRARRDAMTGLLNRGTFLLDLARRLARRRRPGALLLVDIDNLKPINDRHGHAAGDRAICSVAAVLAGVARPTDLVGRLGGDEFAIWCEDVDATRALDFARQVLDALRQNTGAPDCSIGIAPVTHAGSVSPAEAIARADAALYAAKHGGRGGCRLIAP